VAVEAKDLFAMALGLQKPWFVEQAELDRENHRLTLTLDFEVGARLPCATCGEACPTHDTVESRWRHLNFFQFVTELVARVPRTKCSRDGVHVAAVPWARHGSGFTLLFEALVMLMGQEGMTTNAMSRVLDEHDTRLWRVLHHYVDEGRARADHSGVIAFGLDETSRAKGHDYVTTFVDPVARRVLLVAEGRSSETVAQFKTDLELHGGDASRVEHVSLDMSAAFQKGVAESFPRAKMTFDKFHVIKLANDVVDQVRRAESKSTPQLKNTRYAWLRNAPDLSDAERSSIARAQRVATRTATAYRIKVRLQELYKLARGAAALEIVKLYDSAIRCKPPQVKRLGRTIREHCQGILSHWDSGLTNGLLEGLNSLIQAAKARARGFRSFRKMQTVIYLLLGRLNFRLPSLFAVPRPLLTTS